MFKDFIINDPRKDRSAVRRKKPFVWLDSQEKFGYNMPKEEYFNYNNDFINW